MWIRIGALVAILWVAALPAAGQSPPKPPANDDCLACHDATATRPNGQSMAVDAKRFETSTHGPMACVDCHADLATLTEFPHADKLAKRYTGKQRFYGDVYPVERQQQETRVVVRIEPVKVTHDAIFR